MDIYDLLRRSGVIAAAARHCRLEHAQASALARAFLPALVQGVRDRHARAGGGANALGQLQELLNGLGGGDMALAMLGPEVPDIWKGETLLLEFLGSRAGIDQTLAEVTCVDSCKARQVLAMLALGLGGYLAARLAGWRGVADSPALDDLLGLEGV